MGVAITIRDVPRAVRDELAARAARSGQSLQGRAAATGTRVSARQILTARQAPECAARSTAPGIDGD